MKISCILKDSRWESGIFSEWRAEKLREAAKELGVKFEIRDIKNLNKKENYTDLGEVIFWLCSSLDTKSQRASLYYYFGEERFFNKGLIKTPFLPFKFFQQKSIENNKRLSKYSIKTFTFNNKRELLNFIKNEQGLRFPIICKPNLGSMGEKVKIYRGKEDLSADRIRFTQVIFQNYIENNGDYRVLTLGKKPLGVMKRKATKGGYLNNISQGGSSFDYSEKKEAKEMMQIAKELVVLFDLNFCGVDLIRDKSTKKLYFLELNTTPQWKGFGNITGINVANRLIKEMVKFYRLNHDK